MQQNSQTKISKKESNKYKKTKDEAKNKKKSAESSDDDNSFYTDDDEDDINIHEYRKMLKQMFPSKHLDNKIKAGEQLKKTLKNLKEEEDNKEKENKEKDAEGTKNKKRIQTQVTQNNNQKKAKREEEEHIQKKKQTKPQVKKNNKQKKEEEDAESTEDSDLDESEDSDSDYTEDSNDESEELGSEDSDSSSDYEDEEEEKNKLGKFNIILTIGKDKNDNEFEDMINEEWETCSSSSSNTENEDDPISSDSESEKEKGKGKEKKKEINKKTIKSQKCENKVVTNNTNSNSIINGNDNVVLLQLKDMLLKNPKDKSIQKCIDVYDTNMKKEKEHLEKKVKKEKDRNIRIFKKILRDKNTMNDFEFYNKLEVDKQKKIIKELREVNKISRVEKPYRLTLLESDIPVIFKAAAMKKISSLRYMEPGSGEFYKIKNWVDTFMRIPFSEYKTLPISINDGVETCHDFMANAQQTLNEAVYGLNDAKMQIMQMLGQLITNPKAIGSAIAIHGPAGTGKTTLVKEGISKILNRPFAFIALGGATDSSFLEGHSYTYEGSTWGKIVQIIIESKCMNPVIYFDELDKISDTPRGEEIAGILTHLTDTSQNSQFHDKYFADINFDLSKCLFIFSYNDETKVNPILKDRMYRIKTKGYVSKEKTIIANNYLLPKIREQVRFVEGQIIIPNDVISHVIDTHCNKEDGVRNLKRCLEIIHTKLNLYRLMKPGSNLFEGEMSLNVEFPFTVTKAIVDKLIKRETDGLETWRSLYA
jgi:ATP-dependent Lon protease